MVTSVYGENEQGDVTLRLTRDDYTRLILALGYATGAAMKQPGGMSVDDLLRLMNRLNEGNSNYRPYAVDEGNSGDG